MTPSLCARLRAPCVALFLLAGAAHAEDAPRAAAPAAKADPARLALARKVIEAGGLAEQMADIQKSMREGFEAGAARARKEAPVTPEARARLQRMGAAVVEAYRPQLFVERIAASLAEGDEAQLRAVQAELDTPLIKRMTEVEKEPSDTAAERQYFERLRGKPLAKERLALLARIDEASGATLLGTQVAVTTTKLLIYASPGIDATQAARAGAEVDARRPVMQTQMRAQILAQFTYTYRNVSDADLEAYARQNEGPNLRWFNARIAAALSAQFEESAVKMAKAFHEIMTPGGAAAVT